MIQSCLNSTSKSGPTTIEPIFLNAQDHSFLQIMLSQQVCLLLVLIVLLVSLALLVLLYENETILININVN